MGWKFGLYRKLKSAYSFYGVIIIAMVLGMLLNFLGLDPIRALIYSAVANGIVAPVILFFVVRLSGDKKLMGKHANRPITGAIGWIVTALMALAGLSVIVSLFV
jgi:Mn2+/Fe2+ NRAMP family transporter